jgi:hypothetical protein
MLGLTCIKAFLLNTRSFQFPSQSSALPFTALVPYFNMSPDPFKLVGKFDVAQFGNRLGYSELPARDHKEEAKEHESAMKKWLDAENKEQVEVISTIPFYVARTTS